MFNYRWISYILQYLKWKDAFMYMNTICKYNWWYNLHYYDLQYLYFLIDEWMIILNYKFCDITLPPHSPALNSITRLDLQSYDSSPLFSIQLNFSTISSHQHPSWCNSSDLQYSCWHSINLEQLHKTLCVSCSIKFSVVFATKLFTGFFSHLSRLVSNYTHSY